MHIWVDADACPNPVKDVLFRAAERCRMPCTLVANGAVRVPPSRYIRAVQVPKGFDVADNHIVQHAAPGDIVVTADIPLAAQVVEKGATAINPRGERYTAENVRERLNVRDFMESLRSSGLAGGGPPPFAAKDVKAFADALDRLLAPHRL